LGYSAKKSGNASFKTVVGDVKFGKGGGWSEARVLQVQYQNIKGADLSEFKDATTQAVVWPSRLASGALVYPYAKAKQPAKI
jgi:branched-chain amino acid transport system substrate-binding protein